MLNKLSVAPLKICSTMAQSMHIIHCLIIHTKKTHLNISPHIGQHIPSSGLAGMGSSQSTGRQSTRLQLTSYVDTQKYGELTALSMLSMSRV